METPDTFWWTLEHVKVFEIDNTKAKPLFSVQGNPLQVHGKQRPEVQLGSLRGNVELTVTDSAESLVSVRSLVAKGHEVQFTQEGCYMVTSQGEHAPLELHGKRWYLKVQHFAGPSGEDSVSSGNRPGKHRRVAPVEPSQRIYEDKDPDEWKRDEKDGEKFLIRIHNAPRFQLFAPNKMKELPVPLEAIQPGRLTKMIFSDDGSTKEDESVWTKSRTASKNMKREWLGETWFKLKPEEQVEKEMAVDKESMPSGMVDADATQEECLKMLARMDRGSEEDDYEPSSGNAEDLEKAMDVGDEESPKAVVEVPSLPSAKEREEHRLHHANFEPWCEVRVQGQGREKHHKRKEESKEHVVYSDYLFFNKGGEVVDKETGLTRESKKRRLPPETQPVSWFRRCLNKQTMPMFLADFLEKVRRKRSK